MIAYCDYISHTIREALVKDSDWMLAHVGKIQWDLDENGVFQGTSKTIMVEDDSGKKYKITVEEVV